MFLEINVYLKLTGKTEICNNKVCNSTIHLISYFSGNKELKNSTTQLTIVFSVVKKSHLIGIQSQEIVLFMA